MYKYPVHISYDNTLSNYGRIYKWREQAWQNLIKAQRWTTQRKYFVSRLIAASSRAEQIG